MSPSLLLSDEVAEAVAAAAPIVALETSVLAQGLPHPRNLDAAKAMSVAVRGAGAIPAWTWVADGALRVGASDREIRRLATESGVAKVARRDLPVVVAAGGLGATTVSATLWAAHAAGVEVMATGGIGGVHPGSGDVSADLLEMARTPGAVVCSGPKSIVDPAATLERLEELGVGVIGYRCDELPFFLSVSSGLPLEHRSDEPEQVAAACAARRGLGVQAALLVCSPIEERYALPVAEVARHVAICQRRAADAGVTGKAVTPFLLGCLAEATEGASLEANLALLEANAALAGSIAAALAGSSG